MSIGFGACVGVARRQSLVIASIVIAALLPLANGLAENNNPANWVLSVGCTNGSFQVSLKGFSSCSAALQTGMAIYRNVCSQSATTCDDVNQCNNPALPMTSTFIMGFAEPTGSCNNTVTGNVVCNDGVQLQFDAGTGKYFCPPSPYSSTKNAGIPNPKCATGKCEGNPVDPSVGNKFQVETEYAGFGPFPLKLVRYYNSVNRNADTSAGLGPNWSHNYQRRLRYDGAPNPTIVGALRGDGKMIAFNLVNGVPRTSRCAVG